VPTGEGTALLRMVTANGNISKVTERSAEFNEVTRVGKLERICVMQHFVLPNCRLSEVLLNSVKIRILLVVEIITEV